MKGRSWDSIVNIVILLDVQAIMVQLSAQVSGSPLLQSTQTNSVAHPQPPSMGGGVKWLRHAVELNILYAFMMCMVAYTFTVLLNEWNR
jgi:hypothetical protein